MPIYEQDPKELLGEGIQQIAAPDDSNFYMETPSLLSEPPRESWRLNFLRKR